jgi:lipoprotein signal peptidase
MTTPTPPPAAPPPRRRRLSPKLLWLGTLTPLLFGFDFASKQAVVEAVGPREVVPLLGSWLSVVHAENTAAAFSAPIPMPLLVVGGFLALGMLIRLVWRMPDRARLPAAAVALLFAGGLGNQLDRVLDGSVTDFLRISAEGTALAPWLVERIGTATWPIFNLADVWLLVGVAALVLMPRAWVERPANPAPG